MENKAIVETTEEVEGKTKARNLSDSVKPGNMEVVLDTRHGEKERGAYGVNEVYESYLTLKIAQYCKAELKQHESDAVYT